jgi:hypothetical protein
VLAAIGVGEGSTDDGAGSGAADGVGGAGELLDKISEFFRRKKVTPDAMTEPRINAKINKEVIVASFPEG